MKRMTQGLGLALAVWMLAAPATGEIIEESGTLRGFLAASAPGAAYDNWISHVVEGISDPGYNDYGPIWVDPQTAGFGSYRLIPDTPSGDLTVWHWQEVFDQLMQGELATVDALLADSAATFHYETVRFTDSEFGRVFWVLREQLDPAFVDDFGTPDDPTDDVTGSFRNGWGVFIVNPAASRPNVLVQVVHPTDDFFAPHASVEMFLRLDAGALSINGAGREVLWTGVGDYANGKSLSDPSRYPRHPIQLFHEAFVARFDGNYPDQAQVVQLHSFDPSHDLATPNIMSAGYYLRNPAMPLRDLRREGWDIPHLTNHPVFQAGDWIGDSGPLGALPVNTYYAINCDEPFYVYTTPNDSLLVPQATTLRGDPNNQQVATLTDHSHYRPGQSVDPFLHVEMDEYPDYLDDGDVARSDLFNMDVFPPQFETYRPMLDFYEPFFAAVEAWYAWMDDPISANDPPALPGIEVASQSNGSVRVTWPQVRDGHHYTYEIVASDTPPTPGSPVVWDVSDDQALRVMGYHDWTTVTSLPTGAYYLAARLRDLSGNAGPLSPPLPVNVEDIEGIEVEIDEFASFPAAAWPLWLSCRPLQEDVHGIDAIWRLNGGAPDTLALTPDWSPRIGAWAHPMPEDMPVSPGDLIEWKLRTRDQSLTGNERMYPEDGDWWTVAITAGSSRLQPFDFEEPSPALILEGDWQRGEPTSGPDGAYSGSNVLATRLDGEYESEQPCHATIENAIRPEYGPLLLVFQHWLHYEIGQAGPEFAVDGARLRTSFTTFDETAPIGGYTHRIFNGPSDESVPVLSGFVDEWTLVVVDLTAMYGQAGYLQFTSETYGSTGLNGWYLDDIQLTRQVNMLMPEPFALTFPEDEGAIEGEQVLFQWHPTVDDDPYATPVYTLELVNEQLTFDAGTDTSVTVDFEALDLFVNGPPEFVWRVRAVSQGDTLWSTDEYLLLNPFSGVEIAETDLPTQFALAEVWPNPFNAEVHARVDLPEPGHLRVALYNVLGQEVRVLTDEVHAAGRHGLHMNAAGLASGVYLLRAEADSRIAHRKLVLVK